MRTFFVTFGLLFATLFAAAQPHEPATTIEVNYTTEGLYNATTERANWINLLNVAASQRLWRSGRLMIDLLAVDNLRNSQGKEGVADNLHIFSAIEDESVALSLFLFGISQQVGQVELFLGVRNVNNDYFTSPWNSVFTGSVNGLMPVISHDYPLSDSPLSAMCFYLDWHFGGGFHLRNSLYNGVAGSSWDARFRFRPARDGILNITEISFQTETDRPYTGNYHLGMVYGNTPDVEGGPKKQKASFWGLIEQPLFYGAAAGKTLALLLQGGGSPNCLCDAYAGAGLVWRGLFGADNYLGALVNRTWHDAGNETALELTYSYSHKFVTIQPALHQVFTAKRNQTILMLKVGFDLAWSR